MVAISKMEENFLNLSKLPGNLETRILPKSLSLSLSLTHTHSHTKTNSLSLLSNNLYKLFPKASSFKEGTKRKWNILKEKFLSKNKTGCARQKIFTIKEDNCCQQIKLNPLLDPINNYLLKKEIWKNILNLG